VVQAVNSPHVKLLYDIYHMQIMEADLVRTIQQNIQWLGHFHTGGVPGRHEQDGTQEMQWDGVMRGIAAAKKLRFYMDAGTNEMTLRIEDTAFCSQIET
jgi:hydroxypyruvate isomerase